jgi:hypothetical protein
MSETFSELENVQSKVIYFVTFFLFQEIPELNYPELRLYVTEY